MDLPPPPPAPEQRPPIHGSAIGALVMGILWLCGIGSLVAILGGLKAKREIDATPGTYGGRGVAIGAIVIGGSGLAGTVVLGALVIAGNLLVPWLQEQPFAQKSRLSVALQNGADAQEAYEETNGRFADSMYELTGEEPFDVPGGVGLRVDSATRETYCLEAFSFEDDDLRMHIASTDGAPRDGPCP